jgi:hypothetical protein
VIKRSGKALPNSTQNSEKTSQGLLKSCWKTTKARAFNANGANISLPEKGFGPEQVMAS